MFQQCVTIIIITTISLLLLPNKGKAPVTTPTSDVTVYWHDMKMRSWTPRCQGACQDRFMFFQVCLLTILTYLYQTLFHNVIDPPVHYGFHTWVHSKNFCCHVTDQFFGRAVRMRIWGPVIGFLWSLLPSELLLNQIRFIVTYTVIHHTACSEVLWCLAPERAKH